MNSSHAAPEDRAAPAAADALSAEAPGSEQATPAFVAALLKTIGLGVAVADPDTWRIEFENGAFFGWFPPDPGQEDTLPARLPQLDIEKASQRLEKRRAYRFDTEVGTGARTVTLEVQVQLHELGDETRLVVECQDVTKRKEAEHMLDSYARMVEKHTREVQRERERAEKLLLNIMPRAVFEEMKEFGSVAPQQFDNATILMLDFAGHTDMAVSREAGALISELNDIFSAFDRIVELFGCERMKTMGDAYMAVAGVPEATDDHAENIARVALRMRRYLEKRNASHPEAWRGRIGVHSGPVVGSIVGVQKYVYDIFGPGVNMASRMEELAEPMQIVISEETFRRIGAEFITSELGELDVKGFGTQRIYSLDAETSARANPSGHSSAWM